jgi:SET domain-containing protein
MTHLYMLQVSHDRVIDATRIGGRMRFANHSCEPNCAFEKWNVRGQERCGVFTIRHIQPGDELTVDYGSQYVHSVVR